MRIFLFIFMFMSPSVLFADPKEDMVKAIVDQCKIEKGEAEKLATVGRTGTIIKFTLCQKSIVDLKEDCRVVCEVKGAKIGQ